MAETLKLCLCIHSQNKGNGIDLCAYQQARELAKTHNVTVYTFEKNLPNIDGVSFNVVPGYRRFWRVRSLASRIRKEYFDLVLSFDSPWFMIAGLLDNHVTVDFGVPGNDVPMSRKEFLFYNFIRKTTRYAAKHSLFTMPGSQYLDRQISGFCSGPTVVSHSGIDFANKPGVKLSGHYALFVGRHVRYKNIETLLSIFGRVRERVPDAQLLTVGNIAEKDYEYYARLYSKVPGAFHLGFIDDIWPLYRGASVYVTCSLWEGEDRPCLEAQGMGVPIVAYNNCSHPEIVKNGKLVFYDMEFEDAMVKFLGGDYRSNAAASVVRSEYCVENVVKRWTNIAKAIL